jgi:hypothetical protein
MRIRPCRWSAAKGRAVRIRFKERRPGDIEFGIIYGGVGALILIALRYTVVAQLLPGCVFKGLTSFPCPTCGATRAALLLAHGEVIASLSMNPLLSLCLMAACLVFSYCLLALFLHLPRPFVDMSAREHVVIRLGAVMLVLMNWSYLVIAL